MIASLLLYIGLSFTLHASYHAWVQTAVTMR